MFCGDTFRLKGKCHVLPLQGSKKASAISFSVVTSIKVIEVIALKISIAYQLITTWDPCLNNSEMFLFILSWGQTFYTSHMFYKKYQILLSSSFVSLVGMEKPRFLKAARGIIKK